MKGCVIKLDSMLRFLGLLKGAQFFTYPVCYIDVKLLDGV